MFTREEASYIKHEFWTAFGRYMSPIPSAEGLKINWVNYHTHVKDVHFRMDAGPKSAIVCILLQHPDTEIQELFFNQFLELKTLLHAAMQEEWQWQLHVEGDAGKIISRIYKEISGVSVFNKADWPELSPFFKQRIIALDSFWEDAKHSFDALK